MSNKNLVINNLEFAKKEQSLSGTLTLRQMPRLCEWLESLGALSQSQLRQLAQAVTAAEVSAVSYVLTGHADSAGQHFLNLQLDFSADMVCQRCFQVMQKSFALTYDYLITAMSDEDLLSAEEDMEEEFDVLTQDKAMDVQAIIVDELIAAVPYAPMHEHSCKALKVEAGEKANPFAVLKGLKKDSS